MVAEVFEGSVRRNVSAVGLVVGLVAFGLVSARADTIGIGTFAASPGGSDSEFTNGSLKTVLSFTPTFEQFDPTLGSDSLSLSGLNQEAGPAEDNSTDAADPSTLTFGYTPPGIAPPSRPEVSSVVYLATMVLLLAVGLFRKRRSRAPNRPPSRSHSPASAAQAARPTLPFGAPSGTQEI
jgi:hypothetical protein